MFASEPIAAGEIVWVRTGDIVDEAEARARDAVYGDYSLQIEDQLFLSLAAHPAAGETAIGFNYSCDPNVGVRGQVTFVTIRDVRAGEELTVDVAMIEGRAEFRLICRCGAPGCRAVQSGTDWCLPDLQRRYQGYFASFLGRRIEKLLPTVDAGSVGPGLLARRGRKPGMAGSVGPGLRRGVSAGRDVDLRRTRTE